VSSSFLQLRHCVRCYLRYTVHHLPSGRHVQERSARGVWKRRLTPNDVHILPITMVSGSHIGVRHQDRCRVTISNTIIGRPTTGTKWTITAASRYAISPVFFFRFRTSQRVDNVFCHYYYYYCLVVIFFKLLS
jgi:hypothetical protein